MRQKLAKALRREANQFAAQMGRTENRYAYAKHPFIVRYTRPDLTPDGKLQTYDVRGVHEHAYIVDGPRFFLKVLKQAWKRGLLKVA